MSRQYFDLPNIIMYEIKITFIFTIFAITEIIIQISCRNAFSILSLMIFQAFKFRSQRIVWSTFELIMITCWNVNHYLQSASLFICKFKTFLYIFILYRSNVDHHMFSNSIEKANDRVLYTICNNRDFLCIANQEHDFDNL